MIHWGIQVGLVKDYKGIQLFTIIKHRKRKMNIEKSIILKKTPTVFRKAPEMADVSMMAEMPVVKPITPEDIINGTFDMGKPLGPEDM